MDMKKIASVRPLTQPEILLAYGSRSKLIGRAKRLVKMLCESHERLRLERDLLAINGGRKEPCVFTIMSGGIVSGVCWVDNQSASHESLKMPDWMA